MSKKILLVEDEAILAMATARTIEKHDFTVITAFSGEKAVETVRDHPDISLILMDINLGRGMDGTETAQEVLKIRDVPIVFHTSHSEKEYVDKVKKITGYGYVLKNSGEFVLIESINMAYTLFDAKQEALKHLRNSQTAYKELEAREYHLRHVNRVLRSIRNINQIITRETDIHRLLDKACQMLIETSGYHAAWIILTEYGVPQEPFYHAGFGSQFSPMTELLKKGEIPRCAAEAIKKRDISIVTDPLQECPSCPFQRDHGEKVTMTIPLRIENTEYGWMSIVLPSIFGDNPDDQRLFREIAGDLSYAIRTIKGKETNRLLMRNLNLTQSTLMTALDNSYAGIVIVNAPDGKLRYVNRAGLLLHGGDRKKTVGDEGIDRYIASWQYFDLDGSPLDPDELPLTRAIKYGEAGSREYIIRRKGRDDCYVTANAAPIYDDAGNVESGIVIFLDITENEDTEKRLIESEEKYRALYENAPLPYQSLDEAGNFIDVNPAWLKTLGYTREEVIGRNFADFLHPSLKAHFEKNFPAFKSRGYVHDVQFKIRRKSGEYRDITFEGCIGYKPDGCFRQTYCVFKDITDQKRAEEELQRSRERYRSLLENAPIGIFQTNVRGEALHVNPTMARMVGARSPEEAVNTFKDLSSQLYVEKERRSEFIRILQEYGYVENFEYEAKLLNGEHRWFSMNAKLKHKDNEYLIDGFTIDITEYKSSMEKLKSMHSRLQKIIDNSPFIINEIDKHGHYILVNEFTAGLLGMEKEEIVGKHFTNVLKQETAAAFQDRIDEVCRKRGQITVDDTLEIQGEKRVYRTVLFPIGTQDAEPLSIVGIGYDITHQVKLDEEKDLLMQEMNHRIKNNLNMVTSLMHLKASETDEDFSDIQSQIEAIRLVHEKISDTKNIREIWVRSYLHELLETIFSSFAPMPVHIENNVKDILVSTKIALSLGLLTNEMATNAIKHGFTPDEEARFRIDLKKEERPHQYGLIISNTGNPFPQHIDIQEPKTLGLQLVRSLVDQLQGEIELQENTPHPVFHITFLLGPQH